MALKKRVFQSKKDLLILFSISILTSFFITLFFKTFPPKNLEIHHPHGINEVVERNYDSPIYIIIAKTLYNKDKIKDLNFNHLSFSYYANHFPVYPILINLFTLTGLNHFQAGVVITWLSSAFFTLTFYLFVCKFKLSKNPFKLSLISLFLPPRWLAVRTIPGTEPLFSLLLIICLWLYLDKKYFYSALVLVLLTLTRVPGIMFFGSFIALIFYDYFKAKHKKAFLIQTLKEHWSLILSPLALLGLFYFYQLNFGNFFAYFNTGTGTNVHLKPFPFAFATSYNHPMSEGFFYLFLLYILGIHLLWQKKQRRISIFCLIYLIPNFFMIVDDLYRYLIPISAFLLIPFDKYFHHKLFKYLFPFFLIGIYIYTLSLLPLRMFAYDDYAKLRLY